MSLDRLVSIMRRLRDPATGCDWDRQQSFATIAPYTIEEAYEVADAIARGDMPALVDELGDLQLQVVFHAQMAEEAGLFTLDEILGGICNKLERRHPHIFGGAPASPGWEAIKAAERKKKPDSSPGRRRDGFACT
jgi:ATP diphosphatase